MRALTKERTVGMGGSTGSIRQLSAALRRRQPR
jgi:hypothetical protein